MLTTGSWGRPVTAQPDSAVVIKNIDKTLNPVQSRPDFDRDVLKPLQRVQEEQRVTDTANALIAQQEAATQATAAIQTQADTTITIAATSGVQSSQCYVWMAQAGITAPDTAYAIIMRESGCNPNAVNPGGGACGIGQQLPCGKWPHAWNDPVGGMVDMQNYVNARYGGWANAWYYWQVHENY